MAFKATEVYAHHKIPLECTIYTGTDIAADAPVALFFHAGALSGWVKDRMPPWLVQVGRSLLCPLAIVLNTKENPVRLVSVANGLSSPPTTGSCRRQPPAICSKMPRQRTNMLKDGTRQVKQGARLLCLVQALASSSLQPSRGTWNNHLSRSSPSVASQHSSIRFIAPALTSLINTRRMLILQNVMQDQSKHVALRQKLLASSTSACFCPTGAATPTSNSRH